MSKNIWYVLDNKDSRVLHEIVGQLICNGARVELCSTRDERRLPILELDMSEGTLRNLCQLGCNMLIIERNEEMKLTVRKYSSESEGFLGNLVYRPNNDNWFVEQNGVKLTLE